MKYNTGGRGNTPIINDRNMGKIGTMSQSNLVTTHGIFNTIANTLDVSADRLLVDVVTRSVDGISSELSESIKKYPLDEQKRILRAVRAYIED